MAGGIATGLLGVFICLRIVIKDASLQPTVKVSDYLVVFLMLVVPGVVVFMGSYIQAIHRKLWAISLVFVGGVFTLFLIVLNAGLNYAFIQDRLGQHAILMDFLAVTFTLAVALINSMMSVFFDRQIE